MTVGPPSSRMPRVALLLALSLTACSRSSAPAPTLACRSLATRTAEARSLYGDDVHLATVDGTFLFIDPDRTPLFEADADASQAPGAPGLLKVLRTPRG